MSRNSRRDPQPPKWLTDKEAEARATKMEALQAKWWAQNPMAGNPFPPNFAANGLVDVYGSALNSRQVYGIGGGSWSSPAVWGAIEPAPAPMPLPVEPHSAPIYGWRAFDLTNGGRLKGLHGAVWETGKFQAVCEPDPWSVYAMMPSHLSVRYTTDINGKLVQALGDPAPIGHMADDGTLQPELPPARADLLAHLATSSCSCGLYGGPHTADLEWDHPVLARVLAYGTVLVDDAGVFRASDMMLEEVCVNRRVVEQAAYPWLDYTRMMYELSGRYGCKVRLVESPAELEEVDA